MSANNWRICPQCKMNDAAKRDSDLQSAKDSYGKIPADEYTTAVKAVEERPELEESLREDWELGTDESGEFYVRYSCLCVDCGFEHRFKHEEQLLK